MDNKTISYNSQTYNPFKSFLIAFPTLIILVTLVIIIARYIHSEAFVVIGWISVCLIPFLFQKNYKKLFTRNVTLNFDNHLFSITEYTLKDNTLVKESTINWVDIQSYKCYFSASNITYIVIYLRNGSRKNFSFTDEKNQEQAMSQKSVFSLFYYFIKQYNLNSPQEEIYFKPSFLTTKSGLIAIYIIVILAITAIIFHIILQPKTSMFSFMGLFIILGLIIKRKTDIDFCNKIKLASPLTNLI